jgi:hypothetical protein
MMTERIFELAKQADLIQWDTLPSGARTPDYESVVKAKKFAELIVWECADILMKPEYVMNHPEELTDYNRGWVNGRLLGIEHIKEHFGVDDNPVEE